MLVGAGGANQEPPWGACRAGQQGPPNFSLALSLRDNAGGGDQDGEATFLCHLRHRE